MGQWKGAMDRLKKIDKIRNDLNEARVVDYNGNELKTYEVGKTPGDFAFWKVEKNNE